MVRSTVYLLRETRNYHDQSSQVLSHLEAALNAQASENELGRIIRRMVKASKISDVSIPALDMVFTHILGACKA